MGWTETLGTAASITGFVGIPAASAITTEGGLYEKTRAGLTGGVDMAGWEVGSRATNAILKSKNILQGTGILVGAGRLAAGMVPGLIAGQILASGAEKGFEFMEHLGKLGRGDRARGMNFGNSAALNTERAYTMRQQSLAAMNRGMNTARNLLGREAELMHR